MKILVVDVGGSHVKLLATGRKQEVRIDSGPEMSAQDMAAKVVAQTRKWSYDVVTIGYPGPVCDNRPTKEPHNLGPGWMEMDFAKAFGHPVKMINDAAMQALGSYDGGRMLFLGLGTGLGSALVLETVLQPLELAHLPYRKGLTFEDYTGHRGLDRLGMKKWRKHVTEIVGLLKAAMQADYVILGGGNSKDMADYLPEGTRMGDNANAFVGGLRLWERSAGEGAAR